MSFQPKLQSAFSRRSLAWLFIAALSGGCAHAQYPEQDPASGQASKPASATTTTAPLPELIQVRLLLVAYASAERAAPEVKRTKAEALERANMLSTMARGGERLAELIPRYSDRENSAVDFGVVKASPARPELLGAAVVEAALALAVGRTSEPIETPQGYIVLERMTDPPAGPEQVRAKHILILYAGSPQPVAGATRTEAEARMLAEQIAAQARDANADWDALAQQYTEEPGGKERAGDLGMFGRGQMVPAFEAAAFKLGIGEVSGVVQSPFGFHVIKRYE